MERVRILATSDVHGYITPFSYASRKESNGGLSKLAVQIAALRDENTIVVDNGDTIQGSPLLYYHHLFESEKENPMAVAMNYIGYDYLNTGNHEFNYGFQNALRFYKDVHAKWICGNISYQNKPLNAPYIIHTFKNGKKIALLAALTDYITNWEQPRNIVDVTVEDVFTFVKRTVKEIQEKESVDAIVLLYHGGYECDFETGEAIETLTGENVGYKICKEIPGITAIVSGHQHRSIASYCNGVCTTQTNANGCELAMIDIIFDEGKVVATSQVMKAGHDYNQEMLDGIQKIENACQEWLDKPLGELDHGDLLIHDDFDARLHKHPMVTFLNEVQLDKAKAQISGVSLSSGVAGFNHSISMRDIVSTYVYPNTLVSLEMSGLNIKKYLEQCAEYFAIDSEGNIGVNPSWLDPKPMPYNYDMLDGIEYTIKVGNPVGQRVIDMKFNGKEFDLNQMYLVVVNNYRATGGGNFEVFKQSKIHEEIQVDVVECIADYIQKHKIIHVDHKENIKVII